MLSVVQQMTPVDFFYIGLEVNSLGFIGQYVSVVAIQLAIVA